MTSSVSLKGLSVEEKKERLKNQCRINQRKYNEWKRKKMLEDYIELNKGMSIFFY